MGALYQTIADAEEALGHAEAAYRARATAGRLIGRSREIDPAQRAAYAMDQRIQAAFGIRDLDRVATLVEHAGPMPDDLTFPGNRIYLYLWSHRPARAASLLDTLEPDASGSALPAIHLARANLALERVDPREALRRVEQAIALAPLNGVPQKWIDVLMGPTRVSALIGVGRVAEARGVAASLPRDCYSCVLARAEAAEAAGRRAEVDLWFAEADRQAPSLPLGPKLWGEALLRRGDTAGAILKLAEAHRRSPRWAEPLKAWGDALAARGEHRGAVGKYREAAERTPHWGALHLAWGRALEAQGKRNEAVAKYRAALGMDLSAADRAEVRRRLATDGAPSRP
jgi:tetratricopeptide (TPR) repeat protein